MNVARCSPLRVRVVSDWHPCHPARLQLDVHVSLSQFIPLSTCANVSRDSNLERFQPNWFASPANPHQAESIGTFTQIPPDLKRFYFGHVACPAVSVSIRYADGPKFP